MNTQRHPKGQTLIEILLSVLIFAMLTSLVIANFSTAQKQTQLLTFTNQVLQLFQRAHTNALTNRVADNGICTSSGNTCSTSLDCGGGTCTKVVPPGGWGIHYAVPASGPATFQIYGDRQDAECQCSGGAPVLQGLVCQPHGNRRFDPYGGENSICNWACPGITTILNGPMTCLTTPTGSADFIDTSATGSVTVPTGIYVTVKRSDGLVAAQYADINFDLTTGKANVGMRNATFNRDPTNILGINCNGAAHCYDSQPLLATVCTSVLASGPYQRILLYNSGLVIFAGGGNATC